MLGDELIKKYPIISDQVDKSELIIILRELQKATTGSIGGAVVEFGCYKGTTSLFIQRLLSHLDVGAEFHVYDSFEGLPQKHEFDRSPVGEQFKPGELAASKKEFIANFKKVGVKLPHIHKGWFDEIRDDDVPRDIKFAFLDGDFYDSIRVPLKLIENKLGSGGVVVVDDYGNDALPGARRAVDGWAQKRGAKVLTEASLAIIRL